MEKLKDKIASLSSTPFSRQTIACLLNDLYFAPCENKDALKEFLFEQARKKRDQYYSRKVFLRGLIEFTNYCQNDCFYCGIRHSNKKNRRYRLSCEQILDCCAIGYKNGLRTFVLQGGEDLYFSPQRLEAIIWAIKERYPDCALTLSVGEREKDVYERWFKAGADRFLLRHETATKWHYEKLHPQTMSFSHRLNCLRTLKKIGYQAGAGMMLGSPQQDISCLVEDFAFLSAFRPAMVGMGPFIPQKDTPFAQEKAGSVELTLICLALVRLLLPPVLLPATTALATLSKDGTIKGLDCGANVIMPNITPPAQRCLYTLYDNKKITDGESVEGLQKLKEMLHRAGYEAVMSRGDSKMTYSIDGTV